MGRAAQVYDFTLTAGGNFEILAEGSYYRILTATGAVEVRRDDGSRVGPILEGQGERNSPFKRLTIRDLSGAANSGTVLICDGDFVDHRQAGVSQTMPGGMRRTLANEAYWDGAVAAASVGNFSMVQLWNPVGSGRNLVVDDILFSTQTSATYAIRQGNVPLATLQGKCKNKLVGGAVSAAAEIRTEIAAALVGTLWGTFMYVAVNADTARPAPRDIPIIIPPGQGVIVCPNGTNQLALTNFSLCELPA